MYLLGSCSCSDCNSNWLILLITVAVIWSGNKAFLFVKHKGYLGMNNLVKGIIVFALIAGVVSVVLLKQSKTTASIPISANQISIANEPNRTTLKLPKLVDLGANKCIPCKMMKPVLDELKTSYAGRLEVVFIDVWENAEVAKRYGISTIPTQVFYDASGKELFRHEGFFAKADILAKYKELGINLEKEQVDGK